MRKKEKPKIKVIFDSMKNNMKLGEFMTDDEDENGQQDIKQD